MNLKHNAGYYDFQGEKHASSRDDTWQIFRYIRTRTYIALWCEYRN